MNSSAEPPHSPSPSAYREQNPYKPAPPDYKPSSPLAEHKGLAIFFAAILIGFVGYGWKVLTAPGRHAPPRIERPSGPAASAGATRGDAAGADAASDAQPVYIEAVPGEKPR